jgi:shikimate dehydrogenase
MSILSGAARVAGIAGWPVAHSRSPRIHGFWLRRHSVDGAYIPLPIQPRDFATAIRGVMAAGFAGANVTSPHKAAAFALCDQVGETAERARTVNTLVFRDGVIACSNTDGFGFLANLQDHGVDPMAGPTLMLGAGGAARAIAATLRARGCSVTICNRSAVRAEALARDIAGVRLVAWPDRTAALADHALLVNATPLGMTGRDRLEIDLECAGPALTVADIVYAPLETPLLAAARARGLATVDGLGMLLHQARPGFAAWFGVDPVVDAELRRYVEADLITPCG